MKYRLRQGAAFTYIELMIVAVIIAVLAGLVVPRLKASFAKYELENFVKSLYNYGFFLQSSAASQGKIYCFDIDAEAGQMRVVYKEGDRFIGLSGRFAKPIRPPAGVNFFTEKKAICFYPDSSTDEAGIDFENQEKDKLTLFFQGANGGIQIQ